MRVMPHHCETALRPRRWTWRASWFASVQAVKADLWRYVMFIAVVAAALATVGLLAASAPAVGAVTAAGVLAVLCLQRRFLGAQGARRRTQECEVWVRQEQRARRRARVRGILLIVTRILSRFAAVLHMTADRRHRRREAAIRLRRGVLAVTLLPRFHSRSLGLARV